MKAFGLAKLINKKYLALRTELLGVLAMEGHVLVVPVVLVPVVGAALRHQILDAVAEVMGAQQQQLDDEHAHLRLAAREE